MADYKVTSASVRHCDIFLNFIIHEDTVVYDHSAYAHLATGLPRGASVHIRGKGYRDKPLTEAQEKFKQRKIQDMLPYLICLWLYDPLQELPQYLRHRGEES